MADFVRVLGDVVKKAREKMGITQLNLSRTSGVDHRTILNIENYRGNPKFKNLYPLIRTLKIDPNLIFYPELQQGSPAIHQLRALINDCSEEEATAIYPVVQSAINMLRDLDAQKVDE